MSFSVEPSDYLGFDYEQFKEAQYKLALSNPSQYFTQREAIIKSVRNQAVTDIYATIYNALTTGTDKGGRNLIVPGVVPHYPRQEVSKFALSAAQTLAKISESAVDLILPKNFQEIALKRTHDKSRGNGIM